MIFVNARALLKRYPGRGIFAGATTGKPAFFYVVTGRSEASRKRLAHVRRERVSINAHHATVFDKLWKRMVDPLRHYDCVRVRYRRAFIANGSHLDAFVKPYTSRLLLGETLRRFGPENDQLQTPRIAGVVHHDGTALLGIVTAHETTVVAAAPGRRFTGIVTYDGSPKEPKPFAFKKPLMLAVSGRTADELARNAFALLNPQLCVCAVAGIFDKHWKLAAINAQLNRLLPK